MGIENFHVTPPSAPSAWDPVQGTLENALQAEAGRGAIRGAQESPIQLKNGLKRTKKQPDLSADGAAGILPEIANGFMHGESENPGGERKKKLTGDTNARAVEAGERRCLEGRLAFV
jgi:hypothetical protein